MTSLYNQFKYLINETLYVPSGEVHLRNTLKGDLKLSNWEIDLLTNRIEQTFNIHLPDAPFNEASTVKEVVNCIEKELEDVVVIWQKKQ